jgi:hypothetical protein
MRESRVMLLVVGLILLVGFVGTVGAVEPKPEAPPPLLAPPDSVNYERQPSSDAPIVADDGRPIAQLRQSPVEFAEFVEVYLPEMKPWEDPETEAYAVLVSVRYVGSGGTVLVTTAQPSPGALRLMATPGEQAIQLGETEAWLSTDMGGDFPNRVLFIQEDLIVTVAGDMPSQKLQDLAEQVAINK